MAAGLAMTTLALALAAGFPDPPDEPAARLRAVDARTGIGLDAQLFLSCCQVQEISAALPPQGASVALNPALYRVRMEASGYRPLVSAFELAPGVDLKVTFEMDPISPPDVVDGSARSITGASVLHGFVVDAETARPVAGAEVALPQMDRRTATDENGYFRFTLAAPAPDGDRPLLATLRITAPAYAPHEVAGLLIAPGATLLREVLSRGERPTTRDDTPRALLAAEADGAPPGFPDEPGRVSAGPARLVALDPPASIRLGTSCSCSTCTAVSVLSLETYVKRGLNDEWIASWNGQSLRAGAVAYRAYGSWYTQHPISGTYDICNTTCCQVNDPDTSSATDAAVDRTAGYMLERGGAVFRAEYSAENNAWDDPNDGLSCSNGDLSCGDGSAGSPAAGWSCLADGVDAAHGCFGHGRGACQWGTQRWSLQGRPWAWILDHYYNDHGAGTGLRTAHMSTPLVLLQAGAPPRVSIGATFQITARADNRAGVTHAHVLLGASLRRDGQVVSDPAHDAPVALPPGDSDLARAFAVRRSVGPGTYDLLVSLYDDVDEDGVIAHGIDLPLQVLVLPAAVEVCAGKICVGGPDLQPIRRLP